LELSTQVKRIASSATEYSTTAKQRRQVAACIAAANLQAMLTSIQKLSIISTKHAAQRAFPATLTRKVVRTITCEARVQHAVHAHTHMANKQGTAEG
jgi:hypothetical protein